MQFSRPMIELVYEIRRLCPSDLKPAVKLANPELFDELKTYYHAKANTVCKALIKELFTLAGDHWPGYLESLDAAPQAQTVKVYRGQTMFVDTPLSKPSSTEQVKKKIYRGRVVSG